MYLCYLDESGTAAIPGNSSHYVLAGLAIPIWHWKTCDHELTPILRRYGLEHSELHTAWILRKYSEQHKIAGFESLTHVERRIAVQHLRHAELLRLQSAKNPKLYKQTKKNQRATEAYIHLTYDERRKLVEEVARCVAQWNFARLFAECVNKLKFAPLTSAMTPDEMALEQVVSRFEHYLAAISRGQPQHQLGILIHDNNETTSKNHTQLMRKFLDSGTVWTDIKHIVETPLFVDSALTRMIQIADLCSYAIRRHLEKNEDWLLDIIFDRVDRRNGEVVGVRHYTPAGCACKICSSRRR